MSERRPSDIQQLMAAHIRAHEHCERHAANAVDQREAGEITLARESERLARYWMRRMMRIEDAAAKITASGEP